MAKSILSQDSRGGHKRDLGRNRDGKQRRFYLGHDKAQAQKRSETLERLWELVEAPWEEQRKHHAMLEEKWRQEIERGVWEGNMATLDAVRAEWQVILEAPSWDSVTLAIADAIRKGEWFFIPDGDLAAAAGFFLSRARRSTLVRTDLADTGRLDGIAECGFDWHCRQRLKRCC